MIWKPGTTLLDGYDNKGRVFINDATGQPQELLTGQGSINCVNSPKGLLSEEIIAANCTKNTNWNTQKSKFQGNLESNVEKLNLPLSKLGFDLVEIIKRGKSIGDYHNLNGNVVPVAEGFQDNDVLAKEKFANKTGLRISLSDSQNKLPGCANTAVGVNCGVRLDAPLGSSIGYQPESMADGYKSTAYNATRVAINGREIWIKVEMVEVGSGNPKTTDITEDILSLGVTEAAPVGANLQISGYKDTTYNGDWTDTRSIIKLQRFSIPGGSIPAFGATTFTSNYVLNGTSQNLVVRYNNVTTSPASGCFPAQQ